MSFLHCLSEACMQMQTLDSYARAAYQVGRGKLQLGKCDP